MKRPPLIVMPFVLAVQAVALVGWLAGLGLWAACCAVLDATARPKDK